MRKYTNGSDWLGMKGERASAWLHTQPPFNACYESEWMGYHDWVERVMTSILLVSMLYVSCPAFSLKLSKLGAG